MVESARWRVGLLLTSRGRGGDAIYADYLAEALGESGFDVHTAGVSRQHNREGSSRAGVRSRLRSVAYRSFALRSNFGDGRSPLWRLVVIARLGRSVLLRGTVRQTLQELNADLLIVNNGGYPGAPSARAAGLIARKLALPSILLIHNTPRARSLPSIEQAADRSVLEAATRVVTVGPNCSATLCTLRDALPEKVCTVLAYVPQLRDSGGTELRAELGISGQELVVGMLAALVPRKRHDLCLRAVDGLTRSGCQVTALFGGDGPLAANLARLAASLGCDSNVHFLGSVDRGSFLSAVDVLVLPSDAEGLPLVILEAMSLGKPVIATDVGDVREAVVDGETGLLVPPADAAALETAIRELAAQPDLRRRMGAAAARRYETRFGRERFIAQWRAVIEETLAAVRPASPPGVTRGTGPGH